MSFQVALKSRVDSDSMFAALRIVSLRVPTVPCVVVVQLPVQVV